MPTPETAKVKRYDLYGRYDSWNACGWVYRMAQRKKGAYVKWEDYEELRKKHEQLSERYGELRWRMDGLEK